VVGSRVGSWTAWRRPHGFMNLGGRTVEVGKVGCCVGAAPPEGLRIFCAKPLLGEEVVKGMVSHGFQKGVGPHGMQKFGGRTVEVGKAECSVGAALFKVLAEILIFFWPSPWVEWRCRRSRGHTGSRRSWCGAGGGGGG
jgi:hypothetical protein